MQEGYECFIEDFRQRLLEATGFGADRIYYKKKEEYPVTPGDRLFIKLSLIHISEPTRPY